MEIMVRYERCLGCHACELACRVAHSRGKSLAAALAEENPPRRRVFVEVDEYNRRRRQACGRPA